MSKVSVVVALLVAVVALALRTSFDANYRSLASADLSPHLKQWKALGRYMFIPTAPSSSVQPSSSSSPSPRDGDGFLIWYRDVLAPRPAHDQRSVSRDDDGEEVLVCLHGFPTSSFDWATVLPDLAALFPRVILFDFLGLGLSEKPFGHEYSITEQADVTETLLAQLGVRKVHVLAHDYGVSVAQELLARHNERGNRSNTTLEIQSICFLNGGLFADAHRPRLIQKVMAYPYVGSFLAYLSNYWLFARSFTPLFGPETAPTEDELRELWSLMAYEGGHRLSSALLHYMADRVKHNHRWTGALLRTTVPLRLINGPADPVSGRHLADRYAKEVPNADVVMLPDGIGHYPQLEAPQEMIKAFREFNSVVMPVASSPHVAHEAEGGETKESP